LARLAACLAARAEAVAERAEEVAAADPVLVDTVFDDVEAVAVAAKTPVRDRAVVAAMTPKRARRVACGIDALRRLPS